MFATWTVTPAQLLRVDLQKWFLHLLLEGTKAGGAAAAEPVSRMTDDLSLLPLAWVDAVL